MHILLMNGWMDGRTDKQTDAWVNRQLDGCMVRGKDGWVGGRMVDGWMYGWVDGWIGEWVGPWIGG